MLKSLLLGTPLKYGYKMGINKYSGNGGNKGNVPPRSVQVIIKNIPSRCAISVKLGTHMIMIGINKYPVNAGEIS
jgi:hypothetical protein